MLDMTIARIIPLDDLKVQKTHHFPPPSHLTTYLCKEWFWNFLPWSPLNILEREEEAVSTTK